MTTPEEPWKRPPQPSRGLTESIGRAPTDDGFRAQLQRDRAAAKDSRLSQTDIEAVDSIPDEQVEEHAQRFSAGNAATVTVGVTIKGSF